MSYLTKGHNGSSCWKWYWGIHSKPESKTAAGETVSVGKILHDVVHLSKYKSV